MRTTENISRREIMAAAAAGLCLNAFAPASAHAIDGPADPETEHGWGPWDDTRVREIVAASHGNHDRVRALLLEKPALAKAGWDWGFGDWESPLDAASHTGRKKIARMLMAYGARPTLFTFAMLGAVDVVKAAIEADPSTVYIRGPHSLTLMHHANVGGDAAKGVAQYLQNVQGADDGPTDFPIREGELTRIMGDYTVQGTGAKLVVAMHRENPAITLPGGSPRRIWHLGDLEFHPAGSERVRVKFDPTGSERQLRIEGLGEPIIASTAS